MRFISLSIFLFCALSFGKKRDSRVEKDPPTISNSVYNLSPSPYDSLAKYSYCIYGISAHTQTNADGTVDATGAGGTGFFIRKKGQLFFVTARHVAAGCGDGLRKIPDYPDNMIITNGKDSFLNINIKRIKDTAACQSANNSADMIVFKIKNNMQKIYSVEKFICPLFQPIINPVVIGFPGDASMNKGQLQYPSRSIIGFIKGQYSIYVTPLNYFIDAPSVKMDDSLKGYSGSPLFVQDPQSGKWRITGIASGTSETSLTRNRVMRFSKIEYAIAAIGN